MTTKLAALAAAVLLLLAACQPAPTETVSDATDIPPAESEVDSADDPTATPVPTDDDSADSEDAPAPQADEAETGPQQAVLEMLSVPIGEGEALTDLQATDLMYDLTENGPVASNEAITLILEAGDERFIPVLVDLLHSDLIGISLRTNFEARIATLELLSGQDFGNNWLAWVEWAGAQDFETPPGFQEWKAREYSKIDPRFYELMRAQAAEGFEPQEMVWGGVRVDGIPALDNPEMIDPADADYLLPEEPVFGLVVDGDARAYPLRIMDWHEMANDVVGGVHVSIAYCTLCGSAIAYTGDTPDGEPLTFGSSGLLYRSNKLMYDRQTNSLWNHLTGEPVVGELVGSEVELDILPLVLTSFEEWQAQHPDTVVLSDETDYNRVYQPGAAYGDYFASERALFPVWQRSDLLDEKAQIYALRINGVPKAYPLDTLIEEVVVNDELAGQPLVVVTSGDLVDVQGLDLRTEARVNYSAGAEVRVYERSTQTFTPGEEPDTLIDEAGGVWQITEDALIGPGGQSLPRISGHLAYWFGWFSFFPNTEVYGTT